MIVKLTHSVIDKADFSGREFDGKPGRYVLWDTALPGLGLRVFPTGKKSFVLSYRADGRKRLMTLGRYGVMNLDKARRKARKLLSLADDGIDPLEAKRKRRQQVRRARTVADLCDAFIERHSKPRKKTWREDDRRLENHVKPRIGHLRLEEVKQEHIDQLYREIGSKTPYEANRLVALLSAMFNLAPDWGHLPKGHPNPAQIQKRSMYREKRRDRPVRSEELPALIKAIAAENGPYLRAFFKLLLQTGLRKSELLSARWENVDLGRGTLRLPDTKAGQPRHVPLSTAAQQIFHELPKMVGNPHVFPSPVRTGAAMSDTKRPWQRIRRAAKLMDLRIHDLRHTVATLLAEAGHRAPAIQHALGHQDITQTMGYVHAGDQAPREALEQLAAGIGLAGDDITV